MRNILLVKGFITEYMHVVFFILGLLLFSIVAFLFSLKIGLLVTGTELILLSILIARDSKLGR